ncbi:MAG: putative flippase GtrA [Halieaceae bacterium]|jgi:putative flippase GtrA
MYVLTSVVLISELVAYALVQIVIFTGGFLLTRNWVFQHDGPVPRGQLMKFALVNILLRLLNWLL